MREKYNDKNKSRYEASMNYSDDGRILGCALFLGASDLRAMGIETPVESVQYKIVSDAGIKISKTDTHESE